MTFESHPKRLDSVLTRRQFDEVLQCLSALARKCRISAVFLVNGSGQILAEHNGKGPSSAGLAALAAGSYAASREMARLLNETPQFPMVLYEGRNQNVFIASVAADCFLIVVFGRESALGMVRIFTRKTIEELAPVFGQTEQEPAPDGMIDASFREALNRRLDQTFGPDSE
ncbi:MAG TPA: hypothetical protein ENN03_03720 [bacterium]|nr:hypothetical protein [bacterium]